MGAMRSSSYIAAAAFAASMLAASHAWADLVLLIPAEGRVPGKALTSTLAHETRYAIVEIDHQLVDDVEVEAAVRQVADGRADNADEFDMMARNTKADWVVFPVIYSDTGEFRLELTAYQASSGRTESVTRDIDTQQIHEQVVEMAEVLLSPDGVGTGALPWERRGPLPPASGGGAGTETPKDGTRATTAAPGSGAGPSGLAPFAGAQVGVASALSRPDDATGSSTALHGGVRAGLRLDNLLELGLDLRGNIAGPKAVSVDASARYWIDASETVRFAPEVAPGLFFMGGGAQDTSFMLRATAVGAVDVTSHVSVEARVGDFTWIPAEGGTVLLGGATLGGVAHF